MKEFNLYLKTNSGKTYEIEWIGVADFDGCLRFELVSAEPFVKDVITVFTNPAETKILARVYPLCDDERVFEGYTKFKSIDIKPDGNIVVGLMQRR